MINFRTYYEFHAATIGTSAFYIHGNWCGGNINVPERCIRHVFASFARQKGSSLCCKYSVPEINFSQSITIHVGDTKCSGAIGTEVNRIIQRHQSARSGTTVFESHQKETSRRAGWISCTI